MLGRPNEESQFSYDYNLVTYVVVSFAIWVWWWHYVAIKSFYQRIKACHWWRLAHKNAFVLIETFGMLPHSSQTVLRLSFVDLLFDLLVFIFYRKHLIFLLDCVQSLWTLLVKEWKWIQVRRLHNWWRLVEQWLSAVMLDYLAYSRVQFHVFCHKSLLFAFLVHDRWKFMSDHLRL